jgi:hypothetical protein
MYYFAVFLQDSRFQPLFNQPQKFPVVDPLLQHLDHPLMIDVVEEAFDVSFYHIAISTKLELVFESFYGVSRSNPRPVSIAT